MRQEKDASNFLYVLLVSGLNIILAYAFSKSGYEAFITVCIALGMLFTLLSLHIVKLILKGNYWQGFKLLCVPVVAFVWFLVIAGVLLSVSPSAYSADKSLPTIKWWIVLVGTLPYLMPRLNFVSAKRSLKYSFLSMLTVLYSVAILLIAAIGFHNPSAPEKNILLVIGVQLQYVMSYAVLKTNYIQKSLDFSNKLAKRLNLHNNDLGSYIVVLTVGLPFILPLAVVMLASSAR